MRTVKLSAKRPCTRGKRVCLTSTLKPDKHIEATFVVLHAFMHTSAHNAQVSSGFSFSMLPRINFTDTKIYTTTILRRMIILTDPKIYTTRMELAPRYILLHRSCLHQPVHGGHYGLRLCCLHSLRTRIDSTAASVSAAPPLPRTPPPLPPPLAFPQVSSPQRSTPTFLP
jgi:hypothetical protein